MPKITNIPTKNLNNPQNPQDWSTGNNLIVGDNQDFLTLAVKSNLVGTFDICYLDPPYLKDKKMRYEWTYGKYKSLEGLKDTIIYNNSDYLGAYMTEMENRLRKVWTLLNKQGIIFVSIDDYLCPQMWMLLIKVFYETNFIATLIWKKRTGPVHARYFDRCHEYVLCFAKYKNYHTQPFNHDEYSPKKSQELFDRTDVDGRRYQLLRIERTDRHFCYSVEAFNKTWNFTQACMVKKSFLERLKRNEIVEVNGILHYKNYFIAGKHFQRNKTLLTTQQTAYNGTATKELKELIPNNHLNYTKPTKLLKFLFSRYNNKNAKILDLYGGSGVSFQAAWELNKTDGGNRTVTIIQNKEQNIHEITYERAHRLIKKAPYQADKYGDIQNIQKIKIPAKTSLKYSEIEQ